MKKIFAIALAMVMVLSMASAFALNDCFSGFDWSCGTDSTLCGKAKFEVVPYVKVNNGCEGFDWQVNDCASAIVSENVYFALKLTLDANVDPEWWAAASTSFEWDGLNMLNIGWTGTTYNSIDDIALRNPDKFEYVKYNVNGKLVDHKEDEVQVFYLTPAGTWVHEDYVDLKGLPADIFEARVMNADDAEVCATIESEHNGYGVWEYGDYTVVVATSTDITDGDDKWCDDGILTISTDEPCRNSFTMIWENGKVVSLTASSAAFMNEVMAKFNLAGCVIGTCVDCDIIKRNFGWDDEFKACFDWSTKGVAVVDPDCVVAIPKTGDVSVVAYAVMAVVAAAGTMLKK